MRGNLQAIQPGRAAGLFFEHLAEIALVGEAHLLRDPANGQIAGADQLLRGLDADAVQILIEGLVIIGVEYPRQMVVGNMNMVGHI